MKRFVISLATALLLGVFSFTNAIAQDAGDYRSAASGAWSDVAVWSVYDGSSWVAATAAPTGSEQISIAGHTITVDGTVSISGTAVVEADGQLAVGEGTLAFLDGGTYEHARDSGSVPLATWGEGSTFLLTGTSTQAPGNRSQSFHHVTLNTPELASNRDLSWNDVTIGGDVRVVSTGSNRWQLSSAGGGETRSFTILGDVILESGQLAVQGTGNAQTTFEVHHYGDVIATSGNFSLARGSQGNGSGTTTWYLYGGDLSLSNVTTQNSNPTAGQAKFVFAGDAPQTLSFDNVTYASSGFHFEAAEGATLNVSDGFEVNGLVTNRGTISPLGALYFTGNGVYDHARNGGSVPSATWQEGSTARFTGIAGDAPGNRGQDYYHLVLDTPNLSANRDLALDGNTIHGDLHIVTTGSSRWQLVGGASGTVTILGDVIMEAGQFAVQGTGNPSEVVVDHYGDIVVTGGNFAVSRGSQGNGAGSTRWNLHEGSFSMTGATTQNSNPIGAAFVFAAEGEQELALDNVTYAGGGLPITVAAGSTLSVTGDAIGGNGAFVVEDEGTLATAHPNGIDGVVSTTGSVTFAPTAGLRFTGLELQTVGSLMPDSLGVLTIANPAGVVLADTSYAQTLHVAAEAVLLLDETGSLSVGGGSVDGRVENEGELAAESALAFGGESVYDHRRDGGSVPSGEWGEGSVVRFTGVVAQAPGNRNQSYHHLVFDTPEQLSNLNMGFDEVTIGGDIHVISSGTGRWYLTSASAQGSTHLTILGDVIVEGGEFSVHGTGNALTTFTVDHYGDVIVTGGNFSIARGSQSSGENSGTTTWTLHEGNFEMAGARSQNSNIGNATFVFAKEGTQYLTLGDENTLDHLPIRVLDGTTLDLGESEVGGNDQFTLEAGALLATAHVDGLAGALATTGEIDIEEAAGFVFNGTEAQVTSALLPVVVNELWIDNEAGVELSQETTINGVLRLQAGVFDNTIPFELGEGGSISYEGGSLLFPVSSEEIEGAVVEFRLHPSYPNPSLGQATIRYDLSESVPVRITVYDLVGRCVSVLVDEMRGAGSHVVEWDASGLASGVYLYRISAGDFTAVQRLTLAR